MRWLFIARRIAAFAGTAFVYWAMFAWAVLPFGSTLFLALSFLFPMVTVAATGGVLISIPALFASSSRGWGLRTLATSLAVIVGTVPGVALGGSHRMSRIRAVATEAMPLVNAIERFERDHGRPPRDLNELTPRYLAQIPSTGMAGYDEWVYRSGADAAEYEGNTWVLLVPTGGPGINFDMLMYFPNQGYPQLGYGGRIERIGAWAYVHE